MMKKRTRLTNPFETIGETVLGAPIRWIPPRGSCDLLVIAGIHGEEPDTTVSLSRALRCLDEIDDGIGILLCANPDGLSLGTRGNANGVDLNRNFPAGNWQEESVTCRWHFDEEEVVSILTGESPGSEPETRVMMDLVSKCNPRCILGLHGPLGCIDHPSLSQNAAWLAKETGLPLVAEIGYPTPGSMGTWASENGYDIVTWEFPCEAIEKLSRSAVPVLMKILKGESPFSTVA